ncbi:katanin p60 ATPase-containing subunit A-like 2 [Lycorma delicatula]|uniref:katanin p60 ATPase-containing subunit A-like 2 n=1 Tax=Lycorma delicatula TaxID=130591 RepID=UPI003F50FBB0
MIHRGDSLFGEEKRLQERKKQLLYLVYHFLQDEGYYDSAQTFENEAQLTNQIEICDNIDLSTILQEYETYYNLRFQKYPKICKKVSNQTDLNEKQYRFRKKQNEIMPLDYSQKSIPNMSHSSNTNNSSNSSSNNNNKEIAKANLKQSNSLRSNKVLAKSKSSTSAPNGMMDITIVPLSIPPNVNTPVLQNEEESEPERLLKPLGAYREYSPEWKEYADIISKEIFMKHTNVYWDDVKGLYAAKQLLKEAVVFPAKYPQLFTNILTPWKGILLFGPPGTGKTLLAKAVATESKTTFFNISASSIVSKWRGDSEKLVRVLFEVARLQAPSTIFLDELDALASKRDGLIEHEASRRLKTELLIQLDGLAQTEDKVFLLATSNLPWDLDPAILRRLEKRILIDLPNTEARMSMMKHHLPPVIIEKTTPQLKCRIDYEQLAQKMEGYSGSDIKLVCKETAMNAMRKAFSALELSTASELKSLELKIITTEDVEEAIERTRPSASHMLPKLKKWQDEFGAV